MFDDDRHSVRDSSEDVPYRFNDASMQLFCQGMLLTMAMLMGLRLLHRRFHLHAI